MIPDIYDQFCDLDEFIADSGISTLKDVPASRLSYLETGGLISRFIQPRSSSELQEVIQFLIESVYDFKIVGNTSNLLFLDNVNYGVIVSTLSVNSKFINKEKNVIIADAGVMIPELSRFALQNALSGFEGLEGIPGTVGGGLYMNAGAYGSELRDTLLSVLVLDETGATIEIGADELELKHRNSAIRSGKRNWLVLSASFKLKKSSAGDIYSKMEGYHAKRHKYQEFVYPNLGSLYSGNIYRALARKDFYFFICLASFSFFRYRFKLFHRESPLNRQWINDIAVKRFKIISTKKNFSDKTINCLVNTGQGTEEMVSFINEMERLVGTEIDIENEIVRGFGH